MSLPTAVETFEHIIRHQSPRELVPFLLALEKKDVVAVRERLKSLKKELESIVQKSPNSWGINGTTEQLNGLFLAGFAVFSRREGVSSLNPGWRLGPLNQPDSSAELQEQLLVILKAIRPDWLGDWLLRLHHSANAWGLNYALLRRLEAEQLIDYSPALASRAMVQALWAWGNEVSGVVPIPFDGAESIADKIRADRLLLHRDLPLLFDFDTAVDAGQGACIQPKMPLNQKGIEAENGRVMMHPWEVWNQKHPLQYVSWQDVLLALLATGHLDRADILTRSLLALRRDFRRSLLTWFKELFLSLKPTLAERLARQTELVELLAHPLPVVVNFALEQVKHLLPEPGFALAPLLLSVDNLLLRADLKTGLKSLLAALARLPAQNPTHAAAVGQLLASALAHPDGGVQERAAKDVAALLANPRFPLLADERAAITATIAQAADLLKAAPRAMLAPWLEAAPAPAVPTGTGPAYQPGPNFVPDLSAATAIAPVADWHELLFLTGQVLRHDDPAALERWLDGLLRLQGQLPTGHAEQLWPYVISAVPILKGKPRADIELILTSNSTHGHAGLAEALLLSWHQGFDKLRVAGVPLCSTHTVAHPLVQVEQQRLGQVEALLHQRVTLPLLSTPTHAPYWITPPVLLERLLAYQAAGQVPAPADLAVALARTAHQHPDAAAARLRLPQLLFEPLRALLAWFLGKGNEPLPHWPASAGATAGALKRVVSQASGTSPAESLAGAMPHLWAVAARTKDPAGHFPTLPDLLGHDYPGVALPCNPVLVAETHENRYTDYSKPGEPEGVHQWVELHLRPALASVVPPAPLLLYAQGSQPSGAGRWESNMELGDDFPFLVALVPACPAALCEAVVAAAAWATNLEAAERDLLAQGLRSLLGAGPRFEAAASLLLASGLVHSTPLCRSLALEVLLQALAGQRLVPALLGQVLGQQLATGYAPVARLADQLTQACGLNAVTDDALRQVLEALLPGLPTAAPLRNTRKLLDLYADLTARTRRPVPATVQAHLREWNRLPALKKLTASLLA